MTHRNRLGFDFPGSNPLAARRRVENLSGFLLFSVRARIDTANGPAWAALTKHGSQESGLGKRSSRDRCETTNRSVLALVEGPEQACMKVTRAFACIPMNRPPCALGDCMADEQQSWSSPDRVTRLSYGETKVINGVKPETLKNWLQDQGAEIRPLTNPWEVLRFRMKGIVHVVYQNAKGRVTCDQTTLEYAALCARGKTVKTPEKRPSAQGIANGWARNIIKRGHGLKAILLCATTGPERVQSCGCDNVLPWEDCEHTKAS